MANFSKLIGVAKKALDSKSASGATGGSGGQTDWRSMVRSAADAITGDGRTAPTQQGGQPNPFGAAPASAPVSAPRQPAAQVSPEDRAAIARYDYLLQTAEPAAIEQVHRDAFERLTPAQREQIEQRMRAELPAHEQPRSSGAGDLARTAARTEASRPGMLKCLLARVGGGTGGGGGGFGRSAMIGGAVGGTALAAGGILGAVAGGAILSSVATPLPARAGSGSRCRLRCARGIARPGRSHRGRRRSGGECRGSGQRPRRAGVGSGRADQRIRVRLRTRRHLRALSARRCCGQTGDRSTFSIDLPL
jgi:hypothetical protein